MNVLCDRCDQAQDKGAGPAIFRTGIRKMKGRTLGALLAGSLIVATAILARPVAASLGRDSDTIQFGWSRTSGVNNYVDETWWAVRSHCAPDNLAERLLCIP